MAVRRVLIPIVLLPAAALLLHAWGRSARPAPATATEATVLRVVDGDTIRVRTAGGAVERVRYIGVDTPESVRPGTPVQCFAEAASAYNRGLVAGRRVTLLTDVERRDRYGRLLAYVYRRPDGLFINAELVRRGFARPLTIRPDVRFARRFGVLARAARAAGKGLWGAC